MVDTFCRCHLSYNEKRDLFFPPNPVTCRTCHKPRIKKKIDLNDFSNQHQNLICMSGGPHGPHGVAPGALPGVAPGVAPGALPGLVPAAAPVAAPGALPVVAGVAPGIAPPAAPVAAPGAVPGAPSPIILIIII